MESAQRDFVSALLHCIFEEGLISRSTYSEALNLVHSSIDFPALFRYPLYCRKEVSADEYTENTQ